MITNTVNAGLDPATDIATVPQNYTQERRISDEDFRVKHTHA